MSVFVDNSTHKYRNMVMCHMAADSVEELHNMADKIGVNRKWFQVSNSGIPHYDICMEKRKAAVRLGAESVTPRELVTRAISSIGT